MTSGTDPDVMSQMSADGYGDELAMPPPVDQGQGAEAVEHELEGDRLLVRAVAARDVERADGGGADRERRDVGDLRDVAADRLGDGGGTREELRGLREAQVVAWRERPRRPGRRWGGAGDDGVQRRSVGSVQGHESLGGEDPPQVGGRVVAQ